MFETFIQGVFFAYPKISILQIIALTLHLKQKNGTTNNKLNLWEVG